MKPNRNLLVALGVLALFLSLSACGMISVSEATESPSGEQAPPYQQAPPTQGPAVTGHTPAPPQQSQPQATQAPAGCIDQFVQIGPSNIAPGQEFAPGESFQVDWTIKNIGTCTWTPTYALVRHFGNELGAMSPVALGTSVAPEDIVIISLQMTAPTVEDEYPSLWKLQNDQGQEFGRLQNDAPLRVIIRVVATQAAQQPTSELQIAQGPPLGAYKYGYDQTMLVNQCFDLVAGEVVSCSSSEADFKFTFAAGQGGYILPLNELELAAGEITQPSKSICEACSLLTLPLEMLLPASDSAGNYYCFRTERGNDVYYGWLRPTDFNSGGLTFDFLTFDPTSSFVPGEAHPAALDNPFVLVEADQVTLLTGQCFSLTSGQEVSCSSADASFSWAGDFGGRTSVMNGTIFSGYTSNTSLSLTDCQTEDFDLGGDYYCTWGLYYTCFQTEYGNDIVYGWIRPTHCNANGFTFDFRTYEP
ncbi:MAG: NBR1-Ig-like domain-containing protein [Anaerolineales bacterium]